MRARLCAGLPEQICTCRECLCSTQLETALAATSVHCGVSASRNLHVALTGLQAHLLAASGCAALQSAPVAHIAVCCCVGGPNASQGRPTSTNPSLRCQRSQAQGAALLIVRVVMRDALCFRDGFYTGYDESRLDTPPPPYRASLPQLLGLSPEATHLRGHSPPQWHPDTMRLRSLSDAHVALPSHYPLPIEPGMRYPAAAYHSIVDMKACAPIVLSLRPV
jgi:hypothetical protein